MKKTLIAIACFVSSHAFAQVKTSAHYWGMIPPPPKATAADINKYIQELDDLIRDIGEEAEKQKAIVHQKISTVNPANVPNIQNASPAAIQKHLKETQDRMAITNDMIAKSEAFKQQLTNIDDAYKSDYGKKIAPLETKIKDCPDGKVLDTDPRRGPCEALKKQLDVARADLANEYFISGQSAYQAYLGNYAAWIKKTEPDLIKLRDQSFESTGISVKGLPHSETITSIAEFLRSTQSIFQKALADNLVK